MSAGLPPQQSVFVFLLLFFGLFGLFFFSSSFLIGPQRRQTAERHDGNAAAKTNVVRDGGEVVGTVAMVRTPNRFLKSWKLSDRLKRGTAGESTGKPDHKQVAGRTAEPLHGSDINMYQTMVIYIYVYTCIHVLEATRYVSLRQLGILPLTGSLSHVFHHPAQAHGAN